MKAQDMLEGFTDQLRAVECSPLDVKEYAGIVFSGMGGSGIVGDIAKLVLEKGEGPKVPAMSIRGYELPSYVNEDWLVVCISYSGNTEETLYVAEEAIKRNTKTLYISSGGKLKDMAYERSLIHYSIPSGYPPRYALGLMLSTLMCIFGMSKNVEESRTFLEGKKDDIKQGAKELADSLYSYIPIVYGTPLTEVVAFRWKTQINENAKSLCYTATIPELHHNEVVGLDNPISRNLCHFVLLYDPLDHPRVLKRIEITEELLKDLGLAPLLIKAEGESLLQRLLYLINLGDWTSYYLAEAYGYDPLPVVVIDRIKRKLST
ncbi:MAG: bifunctional phosphoglucose/phosphomannose isomerase [Aquificaceae bacterium]